VLRKQCWKATSANNNGSCHSYYYYQRQQQHYHSSLTAKCGTFFSPVEIPLKNENARSNMQSYSFSTAPPTKTSSGSNHQQLPEAASSAAIADGKQQIQAYALQGEAAPAQEILEQLETILFASARTDQDKADAETSLLECREAVLDAWIAHQTSLVQELRDKSTTTQQEFQAVFQAAEYAHRALEQTVPFLSRPAMSIYTTEPPKRNVTNDDFLVEDTGVSLNNIATATTKVSSSSSPLLLSKQNTQAMLHRCNAVLKAWARVSRVSEQSNNSNNKVPASRGIPQRAMFLLQRMEAASTVANLPLTTESYNRVLEAWACSREHLRGTMAEQLFQRMMKKRTKLANGESFRLIIEAWCKSKQKKSAFTATGHLMKLLKRMENGREDSEPTLELYHMVMESWTHAE
jgi:hypothetical protein